MAEARLADADETDVTILIGCQTPCMRSAGPDAAASPPRRPHRPGWLGQRAAVGRRRAGGGTAARRRAERAHVGPGGRCARDAARRCRLARPLRPRSRQCLTSWRCGRRWWSACLSGARDRTRLESTSETSAHVRRCQPLSCCAAARSRTCRTRSLRARGRLGTGRRVSRGPRGRPVTSSASKRGIRLGRTCGRRLSRPRFKTRCCAVNGEQPALSLPLAWIHR